MLPEGLLLVDKEPFIKYMHNGDAVPNVLPGKKGTRRHYFIPSFSTSRITLLVKFLHLWLSRFSFI